MCARCGKPVDRLDSKVDPVRCFLVLVAHCHGEREVVQVPEEAIVAADCVSLGVAFAAKALPTTQKELPA